MPADRKQPYSFAAADKPLGLAISEERFARYVQRCSGDRQAGWHLYTWNVAASGAFYAPLQAVEVVLRNSVHRALSRALGQRWFQTSPLLRQYEVRRAAEAVSGLRVKGVDPAPGRVIAELSLGYWTGLFANVYDQDLWRQHLYRISTPRPSRRALFDDLDHLRTLRNRIAHHEPIHHRKLHDDDARIARVLTGLSPEAMAWVAHHSRVAQVLATRPDELTSF